MTITFSDSNRVYNRCHSLSSTHQMTNVTISTASCHSHWASELLRFTATVWQLETVSSCISVTAVNVSNDGVWKASDGWLLMQLSANYWKTAASACSSCKQAHHNNIQYCRLRITSPREGSHWSHRSKIQGLFTDSQGLPKLIFKTIRQHYFTSLYIKWHLLSVKLHAIKLKPHSNTANILIYTLHTRHCVTVCQAE